jgi:hypothetical protein
MKFVVNGDPVDVALDPSAPLRHGVKQALEQSHNTGRPIADWELRDEMGRLLSLDDNLDQLWWIKEPAFLFVTQKIGAGG